MPRRTLYDILGLAPDASFVDVQAAFREKIAHARDAGAPAEAVAELREAYQVLATPERRREYDESIAPPVRAAPARRPEPAPERVEHTGGASKLTYGVPAAIAAVAVIGWIMRGEPREEVVVAQPPIVLETREAAPPRAPAREAAAKREEPAEAERPAVTQAATRSAEDLFAEVSPSIVRVLASDGSGRVLRQGSGVVLGPGRALTNCHVALGAGQLAVKSGAATYEAVVDVADEELDLCRMRVTGLDAPGASLADGDAVRTGQRVYAIGAPMGLELTISEGIVSSLREVSHGKVIQTTAPVSPGSSGGGLFDAEGRVVGIVTFQHRDGQNLNFALPADWVGRMRERRTHAAPVELATREPTDEERVAGTWWCFGSLSGRNGEYEYRPDGTFRMARADGSGVDGYWRLSGRRIDYPAAGEAFSLPIEVLTERRMVQLVGEGQRLACERR